MAELQDQFFALLETNGTTFGDTLNSKFFSRPMLPSELALFKDLMWRMGVDIGEIHTLTGDYRVTDPTSLQGAHKDADGDDHTG
jgi:hypothetical protein